MASPVPGVGRLIDTHLASDPDLQARFLDLVANAHSVKTAAAMCGINRQTAYDLRNRDPAFAAAWDDAVKTRGDWWEDQLRNVADSEARPRPDTLGIIIGLKMTGRFVDDRRGGQVNVQINVGGPTALEHYSDDDLEALLEAMQERRALASGDPVVEAEVREAAIGASVDDEKAPADAG